MKFIKSLLEKLNKGPKKGIGIYISADSNLEIAEYDSNLGEVKNYFKTALQYDAMTRELNVIEFEKILQSLLPRFEFSSKTPVVLTIPSILISKKEFPSELQTDEVNTALISETEKNYIFKRTEPQISSNLVSTNKEIQMSTFLYSALQKNMIEKIQEIFKRQGISLSAIDISYTTLIKGIAASGLIDELLESQSSWAAMIIKNNVNCVITSKGNKILNIVETPLALKSIDADDLYPALAGTLVEKVDALQLDYLLIANYSRDIDASALVKNFNFGCPVINIENDCYKGQPLFKYEPDPNNLPLHPEVIGAACWKNAPIKFGFDFLGSTQGEDSGFLANLGVTGNPVHLFLFAAIIIFTLLISIISLGCMQANNVIQEKLTQITAQCSEYQAKFDKPAEKTFNLYNVVETGLNGNEKLVSSFETVGAVIPQKVWIESIKVDSSLNADITGKAYKIEDIVKYYKNLNNTVKFNNFKIKAITVVDESAESNQGANTTSTPESTAVSLPSGPQALPSLPPPPAPTAEAGNNKTVVISAYSQKYYAFDFGNPTDGQPAATPDAPPPGNTMPNFQDLTKNLNIGNSPH